MCLILKPYAMKLIYSWIFVLISFMLGVNARAQYPALPYHPVGTQSGYVVPSTSFEYNDYITNVTFAGINNSSGAGPNWRMDYSGTTHATVERGKTYTLSVTVNAVGADFSFQDINVYFDWDNDGDCGGRHPDVGGTGGEPAESYDVAMGVGHANPATINITIPESAPLGTIWMRVVVDADGGLSDYLSYFGYGEIEEYAIDIVGANSAPTDISLSASAVNENVAANTTVGTLSSTDPDAGNTFTYSLVAGTGSTDNASFNISGSSLRINSSPNYEAKSSYSVRIRTTDQGSLTYEEAFTITINDLNEAPIDISLSATSVNENVIANTTIGTLSTTDPDAGNTFTYTLVAGSGDTDNASFNISSTSLRINSSPNFEAKSSYSVRIRTTDQGSLTYEEAFTITINDLNETPTDISLSSTTVNENVAANTTIGTLSSTDPDAANTFTYTLVAGSGSTDNASFSISSSSLRINSSPDYELKSSYSVRIRTTDQGTLFYEKAFTITINNLNEAPTDISLSSTTVNENVAANTTVGTLSSTDPDAGNTFTYTLVAGFGDTDNASFNISSSSLRINSSPDFEAKSSYSVRIRTADQGGQIYEKVFTITIGDVNETPTEISLSATSIDENVAANTTIGTLSSTDLDAGNTFTYTLVAGSGDTDNASFSIDGTSLRISNSPNYEAKNSYSVRVRTTDQGSLSYEKAFTITINDLNEAPTDISLSGTSVDENLADNATVATITTTDIDAGDSFAYTLVAGDGDTDNGMFSISGNALKLTSSANFEVKSSYSLRIRTTDQGSLTYDKAFAITINDVNENPEDITLSLSLVDENVAIGSLVGLLSATDPDAGNTFTFSLVAGAGDTDNASFSINGNELLIEVSPDFETKSSYSVRVSVEDQGLLTFEKELAITISDVNEAPTDISLSALTIDENVAASTVVGAFSTTDPDAGEAFTYALVSGEGDTDNAAFTIVGTDLQINSSPDFEAKSSYSIRVQSTDIGSLTIEKAITINVNNVNEEPSAISLTGNSVNENVAENSVIGTLATTDPDAGDTFTYTLVAGDGDTDNASFNIDGANLRITSSPDFEAKSSYSVRVRATDAGGLWVEETFTVSITNINESPTAIALSKLNVDENVSINTTVGALTTTDPDAFSIIAYSLVSGDGDTDNASFRINGTTLQITVSPNFEAKSSYSVRIRTTDQGDLWYEQAFVITVNDINEVPVVNASQTFSIAENSSMGTSVGMVLASDPDAGTTFNSWTITQNVDPSGNSTPAFVIDPISGELTVADADDLDREVDESFTIKVTVSDGSLTSIEETIEITLVDVNDVAPVITAQQKLYVEEGTSNGSVVGTVTATDADVSATTFQQWTIASGNEGGYFAINASTGEITVADNSGLDPQVNPSFTLVLTVSDGVNVSATEDVTIIVSGINDDSPAINPSQVFAIDENSAFGALVGTVLATDPDVGTNFQGWTILSGNTSDAFSINANGEIAVSQSSVLDYETVSSFTLTIQVSDGVHTAQGEVTVNLNNVNDNTPVVTPATFALDENSANATVVGTVTATDADGSLNALAYTITAGNTADAFAINSQTGELTVNSSDALDFETAESFALTVQVSDGTNAADATVTINLNNVNDNTPVVTPATFALDENSANATVVGTVTATDADGTLNAMAYTITAGNTAGGFAINETTGELTVNSSDALDFETAESFALTVQVSDGTNAADATVTINLNNVNDNTPVVTPATFALDENSANATVVGTVTATDADGSLNALTYTITAGNTAGGFAINETTGELTVNSSDALDFETAESFALTVQVSDGTNAADAMVTINLNNVNDNTPVVTPATFALDENSANATVVGTVVATDADGSLNALEFSITAGNTGDAFAINAQTGELTVNSSAALDFETTPVFALTVSVSDGQHEAEATITVNLNDVTETGIFDTPIAKLAVYPNPANDRIFFKLDDGDSFNSGYIEMFSVTGAKVLSRQLDSSIEGDGLSVSNLKKGTYILKVVTPRNTYSQLIVVN